MMEHEGWGVGEGHSSCLESLRGESKLMTLGNLLCAGCGTGNGGGVGCAGGKVGRNPTLPSAHPPLKGKKGGPPEQPLIIPPPSRRSPFCIFEATPGGGWDDQWLLRGAPLFSL